MAGKPLQFAPFTVDPFTLESNDNISKIFFCSFFLFFLFFSFCSFVHLVRFVLFFSLIQKSETAGWSAVEAACVITLHTD